MLRALFTAVLLVFAVPALAQDLATLTGTSKNPDGTDCRGCRVSFRVPYSQTIGSTMFPGGKLYNFNTDSDGEVPADKQLAQTLWVEMSVGRKSEAWLVQIPAESTVDISSLIPPNPAPVALVYPDASAKGAIPVGNGTQITTFSPGSDGEFMCSDSSEANGVAWCSAGTTTKHDVEYDGSPLASRAALNFQTSIIAVDNAGTDATDIYVVADGIGPTEIDDGTDTPVAGECLVVASGATEFEYGACGGGGGGLTADSVGTDELDDDTDTPVAGQSVLVATDTSKFEYGAPAVSQTTFAFVSNPTDCSANEFATAIAADGDLSCSTILDADVPNTITIDLAATATALAANPTDCSSNQFANAIAADGDLTCAALTDADIPDTITVDLATTATTATTASALASNPADCSSNQFANAIAADGDLTCAALTDADVPDTITIDLAATATALAANPTDCSSNQFANAIAADGDLTCAALTDADVPNTITVNLATAALSAATLSSTLGIASGGTGQTSATAAFDALAPTTTTGDISYYNGTDNVRLGVGTAGQVLTVTSGSPAWEDASGGGITADATNNVIQKGDGTNLVDSALTEDASTLTTEGVDVRAEIRSADDVGPVLELFKARGDGSSASHKVASGDDLGTIDFAGMNWVGPSELIAAQIQATSTNSWSPSSSPADLTFRVVPDSTTTLIDRFELLSDKTSLWTADGTDGVTMDDTGLLQAAGTGGIKATVLDAGGDCSGDAEKIEVDSNGVVSCGVNPTVEASAFGFNITDDVPGMSAGSGADCDGSTDDSTAIQDWIDYINTNLDGGSLYVPEGQTCKIQSTITPKTGVSLLCRPGAGFDVFVMMSKGFYSSAAVSDVVIEGCEFISNFGATHAIDLDSPTNVRISGNTYEDFDTYAVEFGAGTGNVMENEVHNCATGNDSAISAAGTPVLTSTFNDCEVGVHNPGVVFGSVFNVTDTGAKGIFIESTASGILPKIEGNTFNISGVDSFGIDNNANNVSVLNNAFTISSTDGGVGIDTSLVMAASGNQFEVGSHATTGNENVGFVQSAGLNGVQLVGNTFTTFGTDGGGKVVYISLDGGQQANITANRALGGDIAVRAASGIINYTLASNRFQSQEEYSIDIHTGAIVQSNYFAWMADGADATAWVDTTHATIVGNLFHTNENIADSTYGHLRIVDSSTADFANTTVSANLFLCKRNGSSENVQTAIDLDSGSDATDTANIYNNSIAGNYFGACEYGLAMPSSGTTLATTTQTTLTDNIYGAPREGVIRTPENWEGSMGTLDAWKHVTCRQVSNPTTSTDYIALIMPDAGQATAGTCYCTGSCTDTVSIGSSNGDGDTTYTDFACSGTQPSTWTEFINDSGSPSYVDGVVMVAGDALEIEFDTTSSEEYTVCIAYE